MLRLFNSKTDTIDESKMRTRDGRRVKAVVVQKTSYISVMLTDGEIFTCYSNGRYIISENHYKDLMIEVHEPVIVKEYANDYDYEHGGWYNNLQDCIKRWATEIASIIERTKTDGRVTAYRLVDENEYKNL